MPANRKNQPAKLRFKNLSKKHIFQYENRECLRDHSGNVFNAQSDNPETLNIFLNNLNNTAGLLPYGGSCDKFGIETRIFDSYGPPFGNKCQPLTTEPSSTAKLMSWLASRAENAVNHVVIYSSLPFVSTPNKTAIRQAGLLTCPPSTQQPQNDINSSWRALLITLAPALILAFILICWSLCKLRTNENPHTLFSNDEKHISETELTATEVSNSMIDRKESAKLMPTQKDKKCSKPSIYIENAIVKYRY